MNIEREPLFSGFTKTSKKEWQQKATQDLKGTDPLPKFAWHPDPDITAAPYYAAEDLPIAGHIEAFQNRLLTDSHPTGNQRVWQNLQLIEVSHEKHANKAALSALNNGAEGIIFDLSNLDTINLEHLHQDIELAYCSVSYHIRDIQQRTLADFLASTPDANGYLAVIDSENPIPCFQLTQATPKIRSLVLQSTHSTPTEQVAQLLQRLSMCLAALDDLTNLPAALQINVNIGKDYFTEIAKLRAIRQLTYQVLRAYNLSLNPEDIHLHAISTEWTEEAYQPHANMLKGSTAAMSAIIGGCDSLLVEPESNSALLTTRIARNISTILKEESYLDKNADPAAGSYYLEHLTDQLAKYSWEKFQDLIKA